MGTHGICIICGTDILYHLGIDKSHLMESQKLRLVVFLGILFPFKLIETASRDIAWPMLDRLDMIR